LIEVPRCRQATDCGGQLPDPAVQVHLAFVETTLAYMRADPAVEELHRRGSAAAAASQDPELVAEMGLLTMVLMISDPDALLSSADELLRYAWQTHNEVLEEAVEIDYSDIATATIDPRLWRMGQRWGPMPPRWP
jgi:hypothetical protein